MQYKVCACAGRRTLNLCSFKWVMWSSPNSIKNSRPLDLASERAFNGTLGPEASSQLSLSGLYHTIQHMYGMCESACVCVLQISYGVGIYVRNNFNEILASSVLSGRFGAKQFPSTLCVRSASVLSVTWSALCACVRACFWFYCYLPAPPGRILSTMLQFTIQLGSDAHDHPISPIDM